MDLSNDIVIHQKMDDVEFLQFRKLLNYPNLKHAYGLKNLDFKKREKDSIREQSYAKLLNAVGINKNTLLKPNQNHTNCVLCVEQKLYPNQPDIDLPYLEGIDGTITNQKQITLASTNADCVLLLFFDPQKNVIANVHSGWRGTFQKIAQVAMKQMKQKYDSNPKDVIVGICPSIRLCHFEVDTDVKEECENIFEYTHQLDDMIKIGRMADGKQKYHIDTVLINKLLLLEEGILSQNILDCGICSVCAKEKVHSRRVEGADFGVDSAIITLV